MPREIQFYDDSKRRNWFSYAPLRAESFLQRREPA